MIGVDVKHPLGGFLGLDRSGKKEGGQETEKGEMKGARARAALPAHPPGPGICMIEAS
jgi:hypothetical protein